MLDDKNYDFLKFGRMAIAISIALVILSIFSIAVKKFNFGLDFTGGVVFDLNITDKEIENRIKEKISVSYKNNLFQSYNDGVIIKISKKEIKDRSKDIENITNQIKSIDNNIIFNRVDFVGPQVGEILVRNGIISLILSLFGILLYIWFRFKLQFGIAAVIALLHDIIILFGFISLFQIDFDLTTIAAILTVIGYSINDTVVIFDRIRENIKNNPKVELGKIINLSINSNLKRTIYTSVSTLLAIAPLIFSTVTSLKNFSVIIFCGISVGTYSSIFISSSILVYKNKLIGVKHEKN